MSKRIKEKFEIRASIIRIVQKFTNIILLFLIVILIMSLVRNVLGIKKAGLKLQTEAERLENLKKENEELEERLKKVRSEEYIEKQLRDQLGMAREGEIVIILPEDDVVRKFAPKFEEEEEILPDPNWKKWMKLFF